jgi:hypothetical protein
MDMNHFFYESSSKQKVKDLLKEGQRSQAFHRSGAPKLGLMRGVPQLAIGLLGILGLLSLFLR